MQSRYPAPLLELMAGAAVFLLASGVVVFRRLKNGPRLSRVGVAIAAAPSFIFVGLFYSLAFHLRWSLGRWPAVGEQDFPLVLRNHYTLAICYYTVLWGVTVIPWSFAFTVSLLNARWRWFTVYLGIHALSCVLCSGLTRLAPAPFLSWWGD